MNLQPILSVTNRSHLLTKKIQLFFPKIIFSKTLKETSYNTTADIISNYKFYNLPFLIKLKFIKTIKSTTPSIQYTYVLPTNRFLRSNLYIHKLSTKSINISSNQLPIYTLYSKILKI